MANFPKEVNLNEKELAKLQTFYKTAYAQIVAELEGATNFGIRHRKAILNQIEIILFELGNDVNKIVDTSIKDYYQTGANEAVDQLKAAGATEIPVKVGFNQIHREAIQALISDTAKAFAGSIQGVNRSAQMLLSKAVKEQITQQMAVGKVGGKALREIKNNVTGILKNEGIDALVDKGGRAWKLDRYADMLIRTKSVESRNRGMINRMVENGYDLVQVSAHGATDQCGDWEGKILSVTGNTRGYPTLAQAEDSGLFHPNCKHAINTLIPELAKQTRAYNPNMDTITGNDFIDEVDAKFKGAYMPPKQIVTPKTPGK